jgi:tRNA G37 N-methylase Trm5
VAHRVNLGLIPSSEAGWPVALAVLRPEGGRLHVHANAGTSADDEAALRARLVKQLTELAVAAGRPEWVVEVVHLERVKSYAPRVQHVVVDVRVAVGDGTTLT